MQSFLHRLIKRIRKAYRRYMARPIHIRIRECVLAVSCFLLLTATIFLWKSIFTLDKTIEAFRIAEALRKPPAEATILSAGDVLIHSPILESVHTQQQGEDVYDFSPVFQYLKEDYEGADLTVVNLEGTLAEAYFTGHPLFKSPPSLAAALAGCGADLCLLANNHVYDGKDEGLETTRKLLEQNQLLYTGTRESQEDPKYLIQDVNGIRIGILNYVYETAPVGGRKSINAITVSEKSGALINSFRYEDLDAFYEEIRQSLDAMEKEKVEFTIAYIHWGNEYQTEASDLQKEIAQELCDLGIDALIGGHPHVVQPVDVLESSGKDHRMFCAYSLGNHLSNQRASSAFGADASDGQTEDGLMVQMTIARDDKEQVTLKEVSFIPTWVYHTGEQPDAPAEENEEAEETEAGKDEAEPETEAGTGTETETETAAGAEEAKAAKDAYYILPLDDLENLEGLTGLNGLSSDAEASAKRTEAIIGAGREKVLSALPLA